MNLTVQRPETVAVLENCPTRTRYVAVTIIGPDNINRSGYVLRGLYQHLRNGDMISFKGQIRTVLSLKQTIGPQIERTIYLCR